MSHKDPRPTLVAPVVERRLDISAVTPPPDVIAHLTWIALVTAGVGLTVIALAFSALALVGR